MTDLQKNALKDVLEEINKTLRLAHELSDPSNEDSGLWVDVLYSMKNAKLYLEDAIDHDN